MYLGDLELNVCNVITPTLYQVNTVDAVFAVVYVYMYYGKGML